MIRFLITLKDIGLKRITLRIRYELLKISGPYFWYIWSFFYKNFIEDAKWKNCLTELNIYSGQLPIERKDKLPNKIGFNFLNDYKELNFPIMWNNKSRSRLWQFNLHYFDWGRIWIDQSIISKKKIDKIFIFENILDQWICNNPIAYGDGWHSYTISLRIRNWIWFFRAFPEMVNKSRLQSLWLQICWLYLHPEKCHGGNHWLENLTALVLGSLQFENKYSQKIYLYSITNLKKELEKQVLDDGGHEERSAAYHILILDRLVEVGFVIQKVKNERPEWLIKFISRMTKWLCLIVLRKEKIPRFNDSPIDICPPINHVIKFARSYINNTENKLGGTRELLSRSKTKDLTIPEKYCFPEIRVPKIVDLKDTGWMILRLGKSWEFLFKYGKSSPKHLPAHGHSDLFSFDLYKNGEPVIAETGTSIYGNCRERLYERSGNAHNVLNLARYNSKIKNNDSKWIEPFDVWGNFRAGRKAKLIKRTIEYVKNNTFSILASHDGFKCIGALYERKITISINQKDEIDLKISEIIACKFPLIAKQNFHLGPLIDWEILNPIFSSSELIRDVNIKTINSYYSESFGKKLSRDTISLGFIIPKGKHIFESKFSISNLR